MIHYIACKSHMENAERKGCEQDWQEGIRPRLSATFTIDQNDHEESEYNPTIDEDMG